MLRTPSSARPRRAAFTLFEILIVIALIAMLASVAIYNAGDIFTGGQADIERLKVKDGFSIPLTTFQTSMGGYPTTEEGLQALVTPPSINAERWRGPYVKDSALLNDSWGTPYFYRSPGVHNPRSYDIWSAGPDRREGTNDDIGNWPAPKKTAN